jgi:hypothetical protein
LLVVYFAFAALVLPVPVGATGGGLSACTAADSALALTKVNAGGTITYQVTTNAQLANVCGRCASLDYLLISDCSGCAPETLAKCTGLLKITAQDPYDGEILTINNCPLLVDLGGLSGLSGSLEGELYVENNEKLATLDGLDNIDSIGTDSNYGFSINLSFNPVLTSAAALTRAAYSGKLNVQSCPKLVCAPAAWPATDSSGDSILQGTCPPTPPPTPVPTHAPGTDDDESGGGGGGSSSSSGSRGKGHITGMVVGIAVGIAVVLAGLLLAYRRSSSSSSSTSGRSSKSGGSGLGEPLLPNDYEMTPTPTTSSPGLAHSKDPPVLFTVSPGSGSGSGSGRGRGSGSGRFSASGNGSVGRISSSSNSSNSSSSGGGQIDHMVAYEDLRVATNGFDDSTRIGDGGSCVVYRAEVSRLSLSSSLNLNLPAAEVSGSLCAVKVLASAAEQRDVQEFASEVDVLTRVQHPNLVRFLGFSTDGPQKCLVLENMDGALDKRLVADDKPRLGWQQLVQIAVEVCRGLVCLHSMQKPLIHRFVHFSVRSSSVLRLRIPRSSSHRLHTAPRFLRLVLFLFSRLLF